MFGIPERLVDNTRVDLLFFDFNYDALNETKLSDLPLSRNEDNLEPQEIIKMINKSLILNEKPENFNEEKHIVEFLIENIKSKESNILDLNTLNVLDNKKSLIRKIISKFTLFSSKIAANGRMGRANSLIINTDTIIKNAECGDALLKSLLDLKENNNLNIYFSEYIPVNTVYLMRNGSMEEPGFKILRHIDINEKEYFKIDGFGWFPDLQCAKIDIIPLESKKEKIIDIKNVESIFTNRTMPLSEYGLYVIHYIGVAGLSQKLAEEVVSTTINDYSDIGHNEIGKYFKFYKEIWLPNSDSQESRVEIKLI